MSYYDGSLIHVVYNDHIGGSYRRQNLNHVSSSDGGCTWSEPEMWIEGARVFLKDLNVVNGELTALIVKSSSMEPQNGMREVWKVTADSVENLGKTNHNYTTGALSDNGEVIFPSDGPEHYAGGSYLDVNYVNYIRRIHGGNGYVASEGVSPEYKSDSWLIKIE